MSRFTGPPDLSHGPQGVSPTPHKDSGQIHVEARCDLADDKLLYQNFHQYCCKLVAEKLTRNARRRHRPPHGSCEEPWTARDDISFRREKENQVDRVLSDLCVLDPPDSCVSPDSCVLVLGSSNSN